MIGIPDDIKGCVKYSLCPYNGYFPYIACILHNCDNCGTQKVKVSIQQRNVAKLLAQIYLHWNFHRLSYSELLNMYIIQL